MSTDVLERPDLRESDQADDLVHRCCRRCWPLPGPATAFCGVYKEWTNYVQARSDQVCKPCKDPEIVRQHVCLPI